MRIQNPVLENQPRLQIQIELYQPTGERAIGSKSGRSPSSRGPRAHLSTQVKHAERSTGDRSASARWLSFVETTIRYQAFRASLVGSSRQNDLSACVPGGDTTRRPGRDRNDEQVKGRRGSSALAEASLGAQHAGKTRLRNRPVPKNPPRAVRPSPGHSPRGKTFSRSWAPRTRAPRRCFPARLPPTKHAADGEPLWTRR